MSGLVSDELEVTHALHFCGGEAGASSERGGDRLDRQPRSSERPESLEKFGGADAGRWAVVPEKVCRSQAGPSPSLSAQWEDHLHGAGHVVAEVVGAAGMATVNGAGRAVIAERALLGDGAGERHGASRGSWARRGGLFTSANRLRGPDQSVT